MSWVRDVGLVRRCLAQGHARTSSLQRRPPPRPSNSSKPDFTNFPVVLISIEHRKLSHQRVQSAAGGRRGGERRGRARAFAWFPAGGSDGPIESREGGGPARLETTMGQQQNENGDKGPTRWVESLSLAEGPSFDTAAHSILPSFVRPNAQEFRRS